MQENLEVQATAEANLLIDITELVKELDFVVAIAITKDLQEAIGEDSIYEVARMLRLIINFDSKQSKIEYGIWTLKNGKNVLTNILAVLKKDQDDRLMIILGLSSNN